MTSGLVADIGGTHARFGVVHEGEQSGIEISRDARYACSDFSSLQEVISAYLETLGNERPSSAAIAVAAPVWRDEISMTNLSWTFSVQELKEQFGFARLEVINDASAGVLATTRLSPAEMSLVKRGAPVKDGTRLNLIPGTGFGIGAAYCFDQHWQPVQGEGGHIGLAALEVEEFEALKVISSTLGRATPENVLSGPGMLNLYRALAKVRDQAGEVYTPAQLTAAALGGADVLAVSALDMYCALLGSLAGDYALVFGAHGGVFLSGKVLQKLGPERLGNQFVRRFLDKDKMCAEVSDIPVWLVNRDHPGLLGAAIWLAQSNGKARHGMKIVSGRP